jgi:hypothetical protein
VIVVDDAARTVHLAELDTSILCLPHNALARDTPVALEPDPAASTNILMMHGTVTGGKATEKLRWVSEYGGAQVESTAIRAERWDYVALGHYHITTELAPNMWYAGGTERTSTNIWEEAASAKGFLTYDTTARNAAFHPLPGREVVDLPRFSAALQEEPTPQLAGPDGAPTTTSEHDPTLTAPAPAARYLEPSEIDARIEGLVESIRGGLEGKVVRLVITDLPRDLFRALDHRKLREYRATALHFHLDARPPEVQRLVEYGSSTRRLTLEEEVTAFLTGYWQRSSGAIETDRLVALAGRYLKEVAGGESTDPLIAAGGVG